MLFYKKVLTPRNTKRRNAQVVDLKIAKGIIKKVSFYFPVGSKGLLKCQMLREGAHLFPSTGWQYFSGDGIDIDFEEDVVIEDEPLFIEVKSWNEDELYDHAFWVMVSMLREG